MKIREQDFKNIPQKKEFVAVLKKLNSLPDNGNPHPFFEELMLLLSGHLAQDVVPTVYPYLVAFAMERSDFAYVNFIVNLKIGFYLRADISALSEKEIREYLGGMFHLRSQMGLVATEQAINMDEDFKSIYLWNAMMLYSNSPDAVALSRHGRFEKPFKVKCPHCDNDVHSLCINVDDMQHTSNITPADGVESMAEIFFFDDIYSVFKQVCDSFQEKYFSRVLPYVYGSYECSQCHGSSLVIDAIKKYQFQEDKPFIPREEFLGKLQEIVLNDFSMHPSEQWMMTQFIVSGYRAIEGHYSLKALNTFLLISSKKHKMLGAEGGRFALTAAEKILSLNQEKTAVRGEVLYHLIQLLEGKKGEEGKIAEYYQELVTLYTQLFGQEQEKTQAALLHQKIHHATTNPEKELEILSEYYESLNKLTQNQSMDILSRHLSHVLAKKGDFQEAVSWKEKELSHKVAKYENNSLEHGVFLTELAVMHQKAGNLSQGEETFLRSLDLQYTGILEKYHLPDAFFQGKLKKNGAYPQGIYLDANGLCFAHNLLGDLYAEKKDHEKALECYENGMKIREWITDFRGVESADSFLNQAIAWKNLGDKKKAKALAEKALKLFEIRVKQEQDEWLIQRAEDGGKECKTFLEEL